MADTPPLAIIINRSGGTASRLGPRLESDVRQVFADIDTSIDLHLVEGPELAKAVSRSVGDTVVVGGGDGTISTAAGILAQQGRTLAVLPLGTLNHFGQAIGLDGTLEQAAQVASQGEVRCIDLGMAADRAFINNASLGIYPRMVRDRDSLPLPKWLATVPAAARVLWRPGARKVALAIDDMTRVVRTPLLFIGNNRYSLGAGEVGERQSLEDGVLSLYAVAPRNGPGLLLEALRIIRGKADRQQDFVTLADARNVIVHRRGWHPVALDGEVVRLQFPLTLTIRPKALRVRLPAVTAPASGQTQPDPR